MTSSKKITAEYLGTLRLAPSPVLASDYSAFP